MPPGMDFGFARERRSVAGGRWKNNRGKFGRLSGGINAGRGLRGWAAQKEQFCVGYHSP